MAAWKRRGGLGPFEERLKTGMQARGYSPAFAEQIFNQILGFGQYGFPESHAASFALLVYVSSWLKCHEPAAFIAALLNSQPMGFYAPAQLVRAARNAGVEVRAVDVLASDYDCTLEAGPAARAGRGESAAPALRLGLRLVKSLSEAGAQRLIAARRGVTHWPGGVAELATRAELERRDLEALAAAGALAPLTGNRHQAFWGVAGTERALPLAPADHREGETLPLLRAPTEGEDVVNDYRAVGLTLGRHPVALLRPMFLAERVRTAAELAQIPNGRQVRVVGIVITRQRPGSASGVTFVTLEDETGHTNIVVWEQLGERQRRELVESRLLEVRGMLQREGIVIHVIAARLIDRSALLGELVAPVREFR
jgi:error-prone DNA polymerase